MPARALNPDEVRATLTLVADWQLAHPVQYGPQHWAIAPLYDGLIDASLTTGDPRYLAAVLRAGQRIAFSPAPEVYHADAHAAGHAWLRIYMMSEPRNPALLDPFRSRFDEVIQNPVRERLSFTERPRTPGIEYTDRWTWADALYMAPPALELLSQATGDARYRWFADAEFNFAYDALFDPEANLFYRDSRFIGAISPGGEKVFWSRGNGWVYAGLALMLDAIPADHPTRPFYLSLFKRMSTAVRRTQQPDGLWYASLLDPSHVPIGETSGSALFVYGMAWGVRNGILEPRTYGPVIARGWRGLTANIEPDGEVNSVQPIGAEPEHFDRHSSQAYGTGAVLMAGSEVLRVMGAAVNVSPATLLREAERLVPEAPDLSRGRGRGSSSAGAADRARCVEAMVRVGGPVLEALSRGELKQRMPIHDWERHRAAWTHYEAFARTLAGMAPWLELGPDESPEGRLRARYIDLARRSLIHATDPNSPDFMNFGQVPDQPLVESAYLASALLSAPTQLWEPLNESQRANVLAALRAARGIRLTHNNNWYLFPAMVESALWKLEGDANLEVIETGVGKIEGWYLGDGIYGDGPRFQWDYYNSYVMHPMLLQVLSVAAEMEHPLARRLPQAVERAERYAVILERQISPEGTFPIMGRSSAYRFAAFYHLSYMALRRELPPAIHLGAARSGITAVVLRMLEAPGTFDEQGWLVLGAVGSQPGLQESYNSTGSLYVCLTGLVHLGLPADDPFWTAPASNWTQKRIWAGEDIPRDRAAKNRVQE